MIKANPASFNNYFYLVAPSPDSYITIIGEKLLETKTYYWMVGFTEINNSQRWIGRINTNYHN
jgi:hypothetical protein